MLDRSLQPGIVLTSDRPYLRIQLEEAAVLELVERNEERAFAGKDAVRCHPHIGIVSRLASPVRRRRVDAVLGHRLISCVEANIAASRPSTCRSIDADNVCTGLVLAFGVGYGVLNGVQERACGEHEVVRFDVDTHECALQFRSDGAE